MTEIKASVAASLAGQTRIDATLRYRDDDPYAVWMVFREPGCSEKRWAVAREVLADGLIEPAGELAVRVRPIRGAMMQIELTSPDGHAAILMFVPEVAAFLQSTYDLVPAGHEDRFVVVDWDAEFARLGGAA